MTIESTGIRLNVFLIHFIVAAHLMGLIKGVINVINSLKITGMQTASQFR